MEVMVQNILSNLLIPLRSPCIAITIDKNLLSGIDCPDKVTTERIIPVSLWKLIYAIGTIQTRRFAPSRRQKYTDKCDLIGIIHSDSAEFKVKIDEIRSKLGAEVLKTISEDLGVGLSVIVARHLYNIKGSTIQRIYGNDKRPDWSCQTTDDRILIVESKGASNQATSDTQLQDALIQKTKRVGNIKVASLTVIKETDISITRFFDPPIYSDELDSETRKNILRAGHYSSVFSFLGHSMLSQYFSHIRKRLLESITWEEQNQKNNIYLSITKYFTNIYFHNISYVGTFSKIEENKYLFLGVDVKLISVEGFKEFTEHDNDVEESVDGNQYLRFSDGILIIEINNINAFSEIIDIGKIKNYQEFITISDVDEMTGLSFQKFITYLLEKNNFRVEDETGPKDKGIDLVGIFENRRYVFELKLFKGIINIQKETDLLNKIYNESIAHKVVLLTNGELPDIKINASPNIIFIARKDLSRILKNNKLLMEILK